MGIVPYLKAVCKASFRVNKREDGIRLDSARAHRSVSAAVVGCFRSRMVRIIERGLLHLQVQIDHRQSAVFHRIAGAKFDAFLQRAREHGAVKSAVLIASSPSSPSLCVSMSASSWV